MVRFGVGVALLVVSFSQAKMRRHKGGNGLYVVDSSLKPHVMAYMQRKTEEAQRKNTTPSFDAADCVESLPPHYQRQKQGPLTKTVHAIIVEAKHRDSEPPVKMRRVNESDSEDIDDAIDDIEDRQTNNSMNGKLLNLYKKSAPTEAATPGFSFAAYASSLQSDSTQAETDQPVDDDNEPNIDTKSESKSKKPETGSQRRAAKRAASSAAPGGLAAKTIASMICERPSVTYADVGGVDTIIQDLRELIEWPMTHPEIYAHLGMEPPRGILLHGPPGCGKTLLAHAIAGELGVTFIKCAAPEIVSGVSGESEAKIRALFDEAQANAPSLIFIDELDAVAPKRESAQREMERRIVAQLLTCLDNLNTQYTLANGFAPVMVVAATNRPEALDTALRRAGRFDREIAMPMPDERARASILKTMSKGMRLAGDFNFALIANRTPGFVGADLQALAKEAAVVAVHRIFSELVPMHAESAAGTAVVKTESMDMDVSEPTSAVPAVVAPVPEPTNQITAPHILRARALEQRRLISNTLKSRTDRLSSTELAPLCVNMSDFENAICRVQPTARREGFAQAPDVTWADVGALDELREELDVAIAQPIANPEAFEAIGITVPAGVLFFGPPGCGKTLVAKAVANACGASFISVKGPELLNKYVGESEKGVRQVFARARACRPCVIFFDELDALCPRRGSGSSGGGEVTERVVNQMLTEMDGLEDRKQVFVIAATNRPDMIDPAMLRPGRLDKLLYVPLPDAAGRASILKAHCRKVPLSNDVNMQIIANDSRAENFSGADMSALVREASLHALRDAQAALLRIKTELRAKLTLEGCTDIDSVVNAVPMPEIRVKQSHFLAAYDQVAPSVSPAARKRYEALRRSLRRARVRENIEVDEESSEPAAAMSEQQ